MVRARLESNKITAAATGMEQIENAQSKPYSWTGDGSAFISHGPSIYCILFGDIKCNILLCVAIS